MAAGGVVGVAPRAGEAIGSGLVTAPHQGVAEFAAVGVLADWRRRGIPAALTGTPGRAAFAAGIAALMLMAYESEHCAYARAGFTVASEIAFYFTPA